MVMRCLGLSLNCGGSERKSDKNKYNNSDKKGFVKEVSESLRAQKKPTANDLNKIVSLEKDIDRLTRERDDLKKLNGLKHLFSKIEPIKTKLNTYKYDLITNDEFSSLLSHLNISKWINNKRKGANDWRLNSFGLVRNFTVTRGSNQYRFVKIPKDTLHKIFEHIDQTIKMLEKDISS